MPKGHLRVVITAIQHDKDAPSGAARVAFEAARFLASNGGDVWIVAPASSVDAPEHECVEGVNLLRYQVPERHNLDPRRAWSHQNGTKGVLQRYIRGPVQVVYGNAPLSYLGACELFGSSARTCYTVHSPVVKEMHMAWPKAEMASRIRRFAGLYLLNRIERECLAKSVRVTTLSNYIKNLMREIHGPDLTSGIAVIPGWVDLERFQIIEDRLAAKRRLGWPEDVPVLFTLRRLVDRMGLDRLLGACKMLRDRGHEFFMVIGGSGPMRTRLEDITNEFNLQDHVQFLGRVDEDTLPQMYGACDAFVLPTAQLEGFGLIAIEALGCGRPVLASPVGAIPEILNRVERQWMAKSADAADIARLLAAFLQRELPNHLPQELRAIVKCHYDSGVVLSQLTEVVLGDLHANCH